METTKNIQAIVETDSAVFTVNAYSQVDRTGFPVQGTKYDSQEVTIPVRGMVQFGICGAYVSQLIAADLIGRMGLFPGAAWVGVSFKRIA
jgi:hypothetical protein